MRSSFAGCVKEYCLTYWDRNHMTVILQNTFEFERLVTYSEPMIYIIYIVCLFQSASMSLKINMTFSCAVNLDNGISCEDELNTIF